MKGRTFRRCASCGRSPGTVAAGRRCPHKGCNGRITWAWSINFGKVSGKRRRLTGSSDEWGDNFQTEATARSVLEKKLQMLVGSTDPDRLADAAKLPLEDYLTEWLTVRRTSGLRVSTISANEAHVRLYIAPELGQIKLRRLSRTSVKAWAARLQIDHGLKPGTALNAVRTLSKALADAVEDGLLDRNVAIGILRVSSDDRERGSAWSVAEVRQFLDATSEDRFAALWRLLLSIGCRRGEALGLEWRHIDFDASLITFEQAFVYDGAGSHVLNGTKTGQVRRVKLDPGTLDGLRRHLDRERFERRRLAMDPEPAPENPVFVNVKQERIRPDYISHRWAELCDRAGVRRIRLHDARHTAASLLLDQKVPVHQVSALLGHATPAVTHQTYSHVIGTVGEATAAVVSSMYDNPQDDDSDTATGLRDTAS